MSNDQLIQELEVEAVATRKCLANITEDKFEFKPHPTSMPMGYLALLVAEIPLWITYMIKEGAIDFSTFKHQEIKTNAELTRAFEENLAGAVAALKAATAEQLNKTFELKTNGQLLYSQKVADYIGPTINHWVHHRGQLTVYMRISGIKVPSIYGPSADAKHY
jgi:uncharacterized damage-inducible protein DinB